MKKCKKCGLSKSQCECSEPDLIDDLIDLGVGLALDSLFSSDSSSSSSDSPSSSGVDFGGGDFGGGGSGGEW